MKLWACYSPAQEPQGCWERGLPSEAGLSLLSTLMIQEDLLCPGVGEGQGSLACYSPWGRKGSDMTESLLGALSSFPLALRLHNSHKGLPGLAAPKQP